MRISRYGPLLVSDLIGLEFIVLGFSLVARMSLLFGVLYMCTYKESKATCFQCAMYNGQCSICKQHALWT